MPIGPLGTNFGEILVKMLNFLLTKMYLKVKVKILLVKKYTFIANLLEILKPSGLVFPFIFEIEDDI